ncbi:MAG TPA: nuclear transport factor 2 family protein [Mycobacteriales bacterium]|jgi:hypothetical protein|nr:nuclear transport factor 2 family protein [Mycobacteriales bacterium]
MTDYQRIAADYLNAWNAPDDASCEERVRALFSESVSYVDPLVDVQGHDELAATIGAVRSQFPDFAFRLSGQVDGHHRQLRFAWELGPTGAPAPVAGFDVAVLDDDGRIQQVRGFLDRVPAQG